MARLPIRLARPPLMPLITAPITPALKAYPRLAPESNAPVTPPAAPAIIA